MSRDPSFPFYASDWLGSTTRALMTPAMRGAYIDLLCHQWNDPTCTLPDDDDDLAVLSGLLGDWLDGGSRLLRRCFPPHPNQEGRLANPRLLEIRAERQAWREKSTRGGLKSASLRKNGKGGSTTVPTTVPTKGQPKGNTPSPSSSPSPISNTGSRPDTPRTIPQKDGFKPPTLEEVAAYCRERKNRVDANRFLDFYTSKGWMVGKSKMKDWRASVRTWEAKAAAESAPNLDGPICHIGTPNPRAREA